ncbi:MAG TPA: carboxypeptidase-like regulatory domain-containing protein [Thermoanaerobaculia bacterium]
MQFDVRKLCWLWLLIAPAAAHAQLWSGPSAVEVRAEDDHGHALAGAHVLLQYTSLNPKDGPPAVETDSKGRANVAGLAEGTWHVEVSHDGFMTYMAEVNVRSGGRPDIVEVTQFRVPGGGTSLMRVKLSRGTPGPAPVRAAAPPPASPAPRPAPVAPATPPAPEPKAQPAPAPPATEPKAQPAPAPKQEPPAPEPSAQKVPPHPMPRIPPTNPAPAPTPAPAPQPTVLPTPAPMPPAAPPVDAVRIRTAKDRTCVECQPGETALSTKWVISGSGSGCGDIAAKLKGGTVPADLPGGCHVLRIALPAGARYTAYRYEAQDGKDSLDCPAAQPCPNNIGRWPGDPVLVRSPQGTVVLAPFESGPGGEGRRAVLTVYYSTGKK